MTTQHDLWGPVDVNHWADVPSVSGRLAQEDDVKEGRAVFFLENPTDPVAVPYPIRLPSCAILKEEDGSQTPVVLIQAELLTDRVTLGYRPISGGNGIGALPEVEILERPDERFSESVEGDA